jgi:hypothetical protein
LTEFLRVACAPHNWLGGCVDLDFGDSSRVPDLQIGFGRKISFADDTKIPPGHEMSFKDALHIVSTDMVLPVVVPSWAMGLTERLRKANLAMKELRVGILFVVDAP